MWQGGAYMFGSSCSEWSSPGIVAVDAFYGDGDGGSDESSGK